VTGVSEGRPNGTARLCTVQCTTERARVLERRRYFFRAYSRLEIASNKRPVSSGAGPQQLPPPSGPTRIPGDLVPLTANRFRLAQRLSNRTTLTNSYPLHRGSCRSSNITSVFSPPPLSPNTTC
jgi:hypothetical protein